MRLIIIFFVFHKKLCNNGPLNVKNFTGSVFSSEWRKLPRAKRTLWESHDNFKLYVFMYFPWVIKVEPK